MQLLAKFLVIFAIALLIVCDGDYNDSTDGTPEVATPEYPVPEMPKIIGADEHGNFKDDRGGTFFPWGLNYTSTITFGLIDDELQSDSAWYHIEEDFAEMRRYSANAVRVHLQYNRFMLDQWTPDPQALEQLDRLVVIAQSNGLYLIITGLGAYLKEDSPQWYDNLSDDERWETQALFWKSVAGKVGHRSAVFAYDLMNEPTVSVDDGSGESCEWLMGEPLGGYYFVQNITRESGLDYNQTMAAWIHKLTQAIRSEDPRTLITVGSLTVHPLAFYADHLDFVSAHTYPRSGNVQAMVDYILKGSEDKPLVIGEVFSLYCTPEELGDFLFAIDGRYQGLFGHYQGQTLEELSTKGDLQAMFWHDFLLFFMANNPNTDKARSAKP